MSPTHDEINGLFSNDNPDKVWQQALAILLRIHPDYDFRAIQTLFDDVIDLFTGRYPGYCPIQTPYHNLHHTLDVLLCTLRLMHGVHLSGNPVSHDDMTLLAAAALMHDIGYAQRRGEESGSGAQFTHNHVERSIAFMQHYFSEKAWPADWIARLPSIIACTNPALQIGDIAFPEQQTALLGKILGTADLTGQMADRTYLEKLLLLYFEFKEAGFGSYQNIHELLRNTQAFYDSTQQRLREQFDDIGHRMRYHFADRYGIDRNYYLDSIDKNLEYLARITAQNDAHHLEMLKRGGIVETLPAVQ